MTLWSCTSCSKTFSRKGDLTRHRLLHTGVKPHVCPTCGKGFAQFSGLKTHINIHTKAKPYVCGIGTCKKAFGDPSSCSRHRKETHRREGAYKCPLPECGTRIKRRSAFATHLRKHGIDPRKVDLTAIAVDSIAEQSSYASLLFLPPRTSEPHHFERREPAVSSSGSDNPLPLDAPRREILPSSQVDGVYFDGSAVDYNIPLTARYPSLDQNSLLVPLTAIPSHGVCFDDVFGKFGHTGDAGFVSMDYSLFSSPVEVPVLGTFSDEDSASSRLQSSSPLSTCSSLDFANSWVLPVIH